MKKPLETARRWLVQAEHSLVVSRAMVEGGFWAEACFHAEQTAQLALKAYLYGRGRRYVTMHSIAALAREGGKEEAEFLKFEHHGIVLDRYYLATRYPDALPEPAVPYQSFTGQEARQALAFATEIVALVSAKVPASSRGPRA